MKKKLLLVLLVVLMVGILAFSVFACQPKDDGKKDPGKKPSDEPTEEEIVDVKAGPMFNALFDSIDNTIKVVNDIKDEASVSADLYVDVLADGKTYNVDLSISGSIDAGTNANNWALVTANVLGVEIGLFAEKTMGGEEYLYLGQNILNKDVEWSKLSQAESANLLGGKAVPALLGLVAGLDGEEYTDANGNGKYDEGEEFVDVNGNNTWDSGKFAANEPYTDANGDGKYTAPTKDKQGNITDEGDPFEDLDGNGVWTETTFNGADVTDTIASGLLKKVGLIGTIKSAINMVGGTLFAPIDGINTIEDGECDLTSDNGYAARLNIEELSGVISGVMPMLGGLLGDVNLADYQGIVDLVVPMLLGGDLDLTEMKFTPSEAGVPDIRLLVDVNSDKTFGGLHLSYETVDKATRVAFGLDNISFKANSASKPSAIVSAVEGAEELAINLGLDLELDAIQSGAAQLDLNIYPNVVVEGFGEDGYLDINFSKLYAEVILTVEEEQYYYDEVKQESGSKIVPVEYVVAQYNADGYEDLLINLEKVGYELGATGGQYKVPVNLQEKFDNWASPKASVASNAGDKAEKGLVDTILGIVGGIINKPADKELDIIGLVMDVAGQLGTIVDEAKALSGYVAVEDGVATINVEELILALIAEDGLIGESKDSITIDGGEGKDDIVIAPGEIAKDLAKDKVLAFIANLAGIEVADVIGLVKDFTGATLDADDAYANMAISASGYWQNGIGATISAVLGSEGVDEYEQPYEPATISISLNANIIDNKTEYTNAFARVEFDDWFAIIDGKVEKVSYNTANDGGKLLLNEVKKIFNGIISDEQFELDTFDIEWSATATVITEEQTGLGNAPVVVSDGTYVVPAIEFGTYYRINDLTAGTLVEVENVLGVAQAIAYGTNPRMMGPVFLADFTFDEDNTVAQFTVPEGLDHIIIQVINAEGVENAIASFSTTIPGSTGDLPIELVLTEGSATLNLAAGDDTVYYYIDMEAAGTITLTATADSTAQVGIAGSHPMFGWMIMDGQLVGDSYGTTITSYVHEVTEAGRVIICASPNWMNDDVITITVAQNG